MMNIPDARPRLNDFACAYLASPRDAEGIRQRLTSLRQTGIVERFELVYLPDSNKLRVAIGRREGAPKEELTAVDHMLEDQYGARYDHSFGRMWA